MEELDLYLDFEERCTVHAGRSNYLSETLFDDSDHVSEAVALEELLGE